MGTPLGYLRAYNGWILAVASVGSVLLLVAPGAREIVFVIGTYVILGIHLSKP